MRDTDDTRERDDERGRELPWAISEMAMRRFEVLEKTGVISESKPERRMAVKAAPKADGE